jgi:hypothetical protein
LPRRFGAGEKRVNHSCHGDTEALRKTETKTRGKPFFVKDEGELTRINFFSHGDTEALRKTETKTREKPFFRKRRGGTDEDKLFQPLRHGGTEKNRDKDEGKTFFS